MIHFKDLKFEKHGMVQDIENAKNEINKWEGSTSFPFSIFQKYNDAIHATLKLDNGYTVSIVNGTIFNNGNTDLYELGYWETTGDTVVVNCLSENELMTLINEINEKVTQ